MGGTLSFELIQYSYIADIKWILRGMESCKKSWTLLCEETPPVKTGGFFALDLYSFRGSVAKFSKWDYTLEKKSKEKHKCDILSKRQIVPTI